MAGTPKKVMTGIAQWWPVRTATPCESRIVPEVVRVHALHGEGEHRGLVGGRADERDAGDAAELLGGALEQAILVGGDRRDPQGLDVVHRRRQTHRAGDVRRAGLHAVRQLVVGGLLEGDGKDHVAAALPRRHGGQQFLAGVEHADAGRPVQLVRGEGVEVRAQRAHVDRDVRHGLGAIDQHHRPGGVRGLDDALHRQHRAQRIGDMRDPDEARARGEQLQVRLELQLAAAVDGGDHKLRPGLLAHHLPGHDVGVVLECRDQDLVPGPEARAAVGLGDEVDRLGGAAHEHHLAHRGGIDEAAHALARTLEGGRGRLAQGMHAAVHVGVRVGLVVLDRAQHRARALRGGGAVKVHQRMPVHGGAEDREVGTHARHVVAGDGRALGVRGHHSSSFSVSSSSAPARLSSIWRRSSGTSIVATASSRNAHLSRRCAASRSRPRASR